MSDRDSDQLIYELLEGDIDRKHGEHVLAATKDAMERRKRGADPLFEVLRQAHQAKAEEADKQ